MSHDQKMTYDFGLTFTTEPRVVLWEDEDAGQTVAQCLDVDVRATGADKRAALDALKAKLHAGVRAPPAAGRYWDLWRRGNAPTEIEGEVL